MAAGYRAARRQQLGDETAWDRADRELAAWHRARQRLAVAWQQDMTLRDGVEEVRSRRVAPIACACPGPPGCCIYALEQANRLQHAAHVVVRQLADLAARRARIQAGPPMRYKLDYYLGEREVLFDPAAEG